MTEHNTTQTMTPERLAKIEARAEKATPGTWAEMPNLHSDGRIGSLIRSMDSPGWVMAEFNFHNHDADSHFVANAHQDVPALCAALREAWEEVNRRARFIRRVAEVYQTRECGLNEKIHQLQHERDNAQAERDALKAQNLDLCEQRDAALIAMTRAQEQRDALRAEVERLRRGMEGLSL